MEEDDKMRRQQEENQRLMRANLPQTDPAQTDNQESDHFNYEPEPVEPTGDKSQRTDLPQIETNLQPPTP